MTIFDIIMNWQKPSLRVRKSVPLILREPYGMKNDERFGDPKRWNGTYKKIECMIGQSGALPL